MATLLVLEDDRDIREMVCMELERDGDTVICVENGVEGLRLLDDGAHVDAIILDLMMPIVDGYDFLRLARHFIDLSHVPVIVTTAVSDVPIRDQKQLGINAVLYKPFDLDRLEEAIHQWIRPIRQTA